MRSVIALLVCALACVQHAHGACDVATIPVETGQITQAVSAGSIATGESVTVVCDAGYVTSGRPSAGPFVCDADGTFTNSGSATVSEVKCTIECPATSAFNAGHGDCASYSATTGINFNYCSEDYSAATSKFAYQECKECEVCASATPTPTPTPTPTVARVASTTDFGFAGCTCYADSIQDCATQGACEIDRSSNSRCGVAVHSYSTDVSWDMCALAGANSCLDRMNNWVDSDSLTCRDYGQQYCKDRTNKKSTDAVGKTGNDPFFTYAAAGYEDWDASEICCVCGGGTQKCIVSDLDAAYEIPWVYDFSECEGSQVGTACSLKCLGATTGTPVNCQRDHMAGYNPAAPHKTQATLDTSSFPTCPETHDSWGLKSSGSGAACAGTAKVSHENKTWKECVALASAGCAGKDISWDAQGNVCSVYDSGECDTLVPTDNFYSFTFKGPVPAYAPAKVTTVTSARGGKFQFTFSDPNNCPSLDKTGFTWYYKLEYGLEGSSTVAGSTSFIGSVTEPKTILVAGMSATSSYWVRLAAFTRDGTVDSDLGPYSDTVVCNLSTLTCA